MNAKTRRHIAAWLLLAVFVPMLVFSSVHIHGNADIFSDECSECVQHNCHGHLGQQTASLTHCVLCQFLSLPMLAVAVAAIVLFNDVCRIRRPQRQRVVSLDACGIPFLRAPPAV